MPPVSYVPLGRRISDGIDAYFQVWMQYRAFRWSVGVLRRLGLTGSGLVVAVPFIWLLLFFLIPFLIVLKISFADSVFIGQPPYTPMINWLDAQHIQIKLTLAKYLFITEDERYYIAFLSSLKVASISTILCLLLGYPMAYGIARASPASRNILLLLIVLPFWTSFLVRVYAWMGLLRNNGLINNLLMALHIIDEPIVMLQTDFAMYVGIVYSYLPFMVLPLYTAIEKLDLSLLEAASDLGCRPVKAFFRITVPLTKTGIIAGCMLVFI